MNVPFQRTSCERSARRRATTSSRRCPRRTRASARMSPERFRPPLQWTNVFPSRDRVSCSVDHAHLHVLPRVPDLWVAARPLASWQRILSLTDLPAVVGDDEYLCVRDSVGSWQVSRAPADGHPSQLLRRAAAELVGTPERWDWRQTPSLEDTDRSWRILRGIALGASRAAAR